DKLSDCRIVSEIADALRMIFRKSAAPGLTGEHSCPPHFGKLCQFLCRASLNYTIPRPDQGSLRGRKDVGSPFHSGGVRSERLASFEVKFGSGKMHFLDIDR